MKKRNNRKNVYREKREWAFCKLQRSAVRRNTLLLAGLALFFLLAALTFISVLPASYINRAEGKAAAEIIAPSDSFNLFLVCYNADGSPAQLMLLRLDAEKKQLAVMPLPGELQVDAGGSAATLADNVKDVGPLSAAAALEKALALKITFTCRISAANLPKVLDLFGGFSYDIPENISIASSSGGRAMTIQAGRNLIDGSKALALMNFSGYSGSTTRYQVQAGMMQAFAEQKLTGYYAEHAADLFKGVFNLVTTDFTANDLLKRLDTLREISSHLNFVNALVPETAGQSAQDGTVCFSSKTLEQIKSVFDGK